MAFQVLLNLLIAMIWMSLQDEWSVAMFIAGYVLGMIFIFVLRRFFPDAFYVYKLYAVLRLLFLFNIELLKSSYVVMLQIIRPKLNIKPGIIKMETKMESDWELSLLSCLLTLTPGSVVLEVAPEDRVLYLHAMDTTRGSRQALKHSQRVFEDAILEVTR